MSEGRQAMIDPTLCDGCEDVEPILGQRFCVDCQHEIDLDSRTEDPAKTNGRTSC